MSAVTEDQVVFNIVWTGDAFELLQPFVSSLRHHSGARFRFVVNTCPPEQVAAMERFARRWPDRVADVVEVSADRMLRHGEALDVVLDRCDDGAIFAFVDPDILARAPFLDLYAELLGEHHAVTGGTEVWSDHNVRPAEHPGVNGEYFFDQDGFVFGSPHLAFYRAEPLRAAMRRWGVGFGSVGNDIPDRTRARLAELGRTLLVYDTGKLVNFLLQADGGSVVHQDHPDLLHIGGVSHFLAPPSAAPAARGRPVRWGEGPDWGEQDGMAARYEAARFTASVMGELQAGRPAPGVPDEVPEPLRARLTVVRTALIDLVAAHGRGTPSYVEVTR